jgi:hypothetical protein
MMMIYAVQSVLYRTVHFVVSTVHTVRYNLHYRSSQLHTCFHNTIAVLCDDLGDTGLSYASG